MQESLNWREYVITRLIKASGYSAILFVGLIFFFLLREGLPTIGEVNFLTLIGDRWYPIEDFFGILPLISGSLVVTVGATVIAVPFGIATAIYISEIAPRWVREFLKPFVEILGGIPSVVLGFIGIIILSPYLRVLLSLPTGLSAFTGSLLLGAIAIPTIVSVAEDALDAVPRSYRDAALAIGATEWQTIWMVTLPAARSGVLTAIMLGVGRAIGETMIVAIAAGAGSAFTFNPFQAAETMTGHIVRISGGDISYDSIDYNSIFAIGLLLFFMTLILNIISQRIVRRFREVYE